MNGRIGEFLTWEFLKFATIKKESKKVTGGGEFLLTEGHKGSHRKINFTRHIESEDA